MYRSSGATVKTSAKSAGGEMRAALTPARYAGATERSRSGRRSRSRMRPSGPAAGFRPGPKGGASREAVTQNYRTQQPESARAGRGDLGGGLVRPVLGQSA